MVTARFWPDVGGVETHVAEVAPRLLEHGFDVSILTTDLHGLRPETERFGDVPVRRVRAYPASRDYYLAPELIPAIRASGADLVHVQGYHSLVAPLAMAAAVSAGIPFIVTFHSGGHPSTLRTRLRRLQRLVLRPGLIRAAKLIAVSRFELRVFGRELRLSRKRFALIRNGSHLPQPRTTRSSAEPIVVSLGRLERYKGHRTVVESWPLVRERLPGARLRIIGSGSDEPALREMIATHGLESAVEILAIPGSDRQAMADALGEASLVVLLSEYEAHPVAVVEALSAGAPVLVARTTGLTELVDDGLAAGIDIPAEPIDVATAICDLIETGGAAPSIHLSTWDDSAAELAEVYRRVLAPASATRTSEPR